ncbi:MAG: methionyl-tRNA formyltransferase [Chloroflexota bacterium]
MLRLTMLSMPCDEPAGAFAALLAAPGVTIASLVLAGPGDAPGEMAQAAARAGVPVVAVRTRAEALEALRRDAPDLAAAACFPWRLDAGALTVPRLGVVNLHPSLLPAGRGPEPVFWTFRNGDREAGVSVHWMDAGLDTGPVLAQRRVAISGDATAPVLERHLLALGAEALTALLPAIAAGDAPGAPQDHAAATIAPTPMPADWLMPSTLPAAWAWRFARAVAPLGGPLAAAAGGRVIPVGAPVAMDARERPPAAVSEHEDGTVTVRFSPGWVRFARRDFG